MKSLCLVAHGSRRQASNDEVREVAARLAEKAAGQFGHVDCGFLELAEPSIPDGIQRCIDAASETTTSYYLGSLLIEWIESRNM